MPQRNMKLCTQNYSIRIRIFPGTLTAIFSKSRFSEKCKHENEFYEVSFKDRDMWFSAFYSVEITLRANRELFFQFLFFSI